MAGKKGETVVDNTLSPA